MVSKSTIMMAALTLCGGLVLVKGKHRNKYRNLATLVEMRRTDYLRKLNKTEMQNRYSTTISDYYNFITSRYRKANKYLQRIENDWYIKDYAGGDLRKIVARGISDEWGHHTIITDNNVAHYLFKPQERFMTFLKTLPVRNSGRRLKFNGTDYLVRPLSEQAGEDWRSLAFHASGKKHDPSLHMIDSKGSWYRVANESRLFSYVSRLPKTVARADNYRLHLAQDGSWKVKVDGVLKDLVSCGDFVVHVFSGDDGQWYSIKNPQMPVKQYITKLPMDIWDPYNLADCISQIQSPNYENYQSQRELFQFIA